MWNTIKKILNSIINGLFDAILVGIFVIGVCVLGLVVSNEENWLFAFILIMIAFFSSIYYYRKNE